MMQHFIFSFEKELTIKTTSNRTKLFFLSCRSSILFAVLVFSRTIYFLFQIHCSLSVVEQYILFQIHPITVMSLDGVCKLNYLQYFILTLDQTFVR